MFTRRALASAALLIFGGWTVAPGQAPAVSTALRIPADSLYRIVRARLDARGYRVDEADASRRRLVVRAPASDTRVEVRITAQGDSSGIEVRPISGGGLTETLGAVLTVTSDATIAQSSEVGAAPVDSGELPESRWRPELFVSPQGRFWIARGGLYTADSLRSGWRRVFTIKGDSIDPIEVSIGVNMAFADENTVLLGFPSLGSGEDGAVLYRTTDRGKSWSAIPATDIAWVDAMEAAGASVWVLATRWEGRQRRGTFLRSNDSGRTWERVALPPQLNDITLVYRVSPSTAYVATAGFNRGVFWRTSDGGESWSPVPTPHDQRLHHVPDHGVRVEQVATVGRWLVVREYGQAFISPADTIRWRRLDGVESVAADTERDQLFVLTDSLRAVMLDRNLDTLWQSEDRIPASLARDVEKTLARDGVGYVSLGHGEIYEARDGRLRLARPRGSRR